jgi:hypothetical protein
MVECSPELRSEFIVVREVSPTIFIRRPVPKHSLESPERHAKRTDLSIPPVTDAYYAACLWIHVDVVLKEVGMVRH